MRTIVRILLVLLAATCALSCGHGGWRQRLAGADSLLASRPDSALTLLQSLAGSMATASRSDRMYYQLLLADARNKCYVDFTTDSVMRRVADYYDRHGTRLDRIRAHYLLGCTYRDLHEAPQALQCYQDVVELADTTNAADIRLLMKVYGQMAELYNAQNLPQDAIDLYMKVQHFTLMLKDTNTYIRNIEQFSRPYYLLGDTERVIKAIETAHDLYLKHGRPDKAVDGYATLAYISLTRHQLDKARQYLREYETLSGLFDESGKIEEGREVFYYIKGCFFLENHQIDSAELYMRKVLASDYKADAYRGLLDVYKRRNNMDSVFYFAHLYEEAVDSITQSKTTETIQRMTALYDYQRVSKQADREAQRVGHARLMAALFALGMVLLTFLLYCLLRLHRQFKVRKQAEVARLNVMCRQAEDALAIARLEHENELNRSQQTLQAKSEEIEMLQRQVVSQEVLAKAREDMERLKAETDRQLAEKTQEINELSAQLAKHVERYLAIKPSDRETLMATSEIVRVFQKKAHRTRGSQQPDNSQWRELMSQFRLNLPRLFSALGQGERLSTQELRACVLLLLNFTDADATILLDVSPQRLTNIKSRANQKLFADSSATSLISNVRHHAATL